jgi:pimeloyl-ACP methyl ester carboxylesterase
VRHAAPRASFVLLHGAGSDSWYWHRVAPDLRAAGHDVVAVDLPVDDETCGIGEYAGAVIDALGDRDRLVLVAQSMAAFTAPVVATLRPVELIVLVAPMVPAPGETPGQWWVNAGQPEAARRYAEEEGRDPDAAFDPLEVFLHDVPEDLHAEAARHVREQSDRPFGELWPLDRWPDVPTRAVAGRRDRLFPLALQRRVLRERLGIVPDEIDSGHLPALARPADLTGLLLRAWPPGT